MIPLFICLVFTSPLYGYDNFNRLAQSLRLVLTRLSSVLGPSYLDDPKPGPSTTAAEFDLEVFDSGSSCSLEDAWGLGCSPDEAITPTVS